MLEYSYKDDALGDPMINDYHVFAMELATPEELKLIADYSFRINDLSLIHILCPRCARATRKG